MAVRIYGWAFKGTDPRSWRSAAEAIGNSKYRSYPHIHLLSLKRHVMNMKIKADYENKVLKPLDDPYLPEKAKVCINHPLEHQRSARQA
jgi:hypothetical protein